MGSDAGSSNVKPTSTQDYYAASDYYDNFMRRHLGYYGYYSREENATLSLDEDLHSLSEIKQNYDLRLSGRHNITGVEEELDDFLNRTTQLVFQYQQGRKVPKLREPRNLYALTKEAGPQQATRWPSHVQCICPSVQFIDYSPPEPQPLVKATGKEISPSIRGGELIYCNDPGSDPYFTRSRVAGCRLTHDDVLLEPLATLPEDLTLEFESRFESGNLFKVEKISNFEYELTLRPDLYTNKNTQWFFFRVRNMRKKKSYRFTITNLMKPSSLYNNGMQPVFYSSHDAKTNKVGWRRKGENIRYYKNNYMQNGRCHYSLTWTCEFAYDDDVCYFAHCYPYTYTDLQDYLLDLANDPVRSRFCKQRVLCRTLAGNLVYILTITSPSRNPEVSRTKRAVVLTARVHPGETNASWMMKGFLDYLTGSTADAKLLRDTFIFKIVPMLNPDGVIVGNYRCSLTGRDLNRNYKSSLKDSFPSIWHTKLMIKRLHAEREVVLYCDLHGHSRKHNIFIYGCENKHKPDKKLRERVFPLMLSKNSRQSFSFRSCKYKVQKSKEGTGRIVVWCMGIMNSYTMEATFGGTTMNGKYKDTHLNPRDLEAIGYDFCDTILDYCDPDKCKTDACMKELTERMKKRMECRARGEADESMSDSDTSGSDSSVDDGLPVNLLSNMPKMNRKKKLRSRSERNKLTTASPPKQMTPPAATKVVLPKSVEFRPRNRENIPKKEEKPARNSPEERTERSAKKGEYLQALTSAYIRSGLLVVSEPKAQAATTTAVKEFSFNYTQKGGDEEGNTDTGLTTQYLTDRVNQLTAHEQYEILRQSALKKQLSAGQQRILAQKHLAAVASMQQTDQHQQNIQQHTAQALRRFAAMATTTSGLNNHNIFLRQPQQTTYEEVKETEADIHPRTEDRGHATTPQGTKAVVVPNSNKILKPRGSALLPEKGAPSSESGDSSLPSHVHHVSDRSKRNLNVAKTKQSSGRSDPTSSVAIETPDPPSTSQHVTSRATAHHLESVREFRDEAVATPSGEKRDHGEDPRDDHVEDGGGGGSGSRGAGFQLRLASERPMKWSKLKQGNIRSRKNKTNKPTTTTSRKTTIELKKKSKQSNLADDDVIIGDGQLTNDKNANNMSPSSSKMMTSSDCVKAKDASETTTESPKQKSSPSSERHFMRELPPTSADVNEKSNSACGYVTNSKMDGSKTCEIGAAEGEMLVSTSLQLQIYSTEIFSVL